MENSKISEIQKINNMNLEDLISYMNSNLNFLKNKLNTNNKDIVFEILKYTNLLENMENNATLSSDDEFNVLPILKKLYIKLL